MCKQHNTGRTKIDDGLWGAKQKSHPPTYQAIPPPGRPPGSALHVRRIVMQRNWQNVGLTLVVGMVGGVVVKRWLRRAFCFCVLLPLGSLLNVFEVCKIS